MRQTLEILQELTKRLPVVEMRHNFTLHPNGYLALTVFINEYWQEIYIGEEDFVKPIDILVDEIIEVLQEVGYDVW